MTGTLVIVMAIYHKHTLNKYVMGIDPNLLKRYFEGSLSKQEEEQLDPLILGIIKEQVALSSIEAKWHDYTQQEENGNALSDRELLKRTLNLILESDQDQHIQASIRKKIKALSVVDETDLVRNIDALKRRRRSVGKVGEWPSVVKWAATVLIFFLCGYFAQDFLDGTNTAYEDQAIIVKTTEPGEKMEIRLADGSKVILNADSRLIYPQTFGVESRELRLAGEAFFDVAKDANRPFIVTAANITTTALGTSFNIKAYGNESEIQIALVTGKVAVGTTDPEISQLKIILLPGEAANYHAQQGVLEKNKFNAKRTLSWKDNILYFDKTPISEVFNTLERWYGVKVIIKDKVEKKLYFNGEFHNQSLKNVLEVLSYSGHFTYRLKNDKVFISLAE